jgi:hypothetical protein
VRARSHDQIRRSIDQIWAPLPGTVDATNAAIAEFSTHLRTLLGQANVAGMAASEVTNRIAGRFNAGYAQSLIRRINPLQADLMQLEASYDIQRAQMRELRADTGLLEMAYQSERAEVIERHAASIRQATEAAAEALKRFAIDLRKFAEGLLLNRQLSPLDPAQMLAQAQSQYDTILSRAEGGDEAARGELTGASTALLEAGREYWASSPAYAALFNKVRSDLLRLADSADAQAKAQLSTITTISTQVTALTAAGGQYTAAIGQLTSAQIQAYMEGVQRINATVSSTPAAGGGVGAVGGGLVRFGSATVDPAFAAAANQRIADTDAAYLRDNPDVAAAMRDGRHRGSTWDHWRFHGVHEGRDFGNLDINDQNRQHFSAYHTVSNDNQARGNQDLPDVRVVNYFASSPDVAAAFRRGEFGALTAEQAARTHWEQFGRNEQGRTAFATTGSFRVGGRGGVDSQLIPLRLTPGEIVDVRRPYQPPASSGSNLGLLADRLDRIAVLLEDVVATTAAGTLDLGRAIAEQAAVARDAAGDARLAALKPRRAA